MAFLLADLTDGTLDDPVSAAPYASAADAANANAQLILDTAASSADTLRRQAADQLGYNSVVLGSVDEYRNLTADQQVQLTDTMAHLIMQNPGNWSPQVQNDAALRVNNAYYGKPLDDTSFSSNLVAQIANGTFLDSALGGAQKYVTVLVILSIGLVILHATLTSGGRGRSQSAIASST